MIWEVVLSNKTPMLQLLSNCTTIVWT